MDFDVVVIGGGPGGYVAAIRAAQLGLKTACIEARGALGGTCLNVGCIPSKALLKSTEVFAETRDHAADHGVVVSSVKLDVAKMMERKQDIVKGLTDGIEHLLKKHKITYFKGYGSFVSKSEVKITPTDKDGKEQTIKASSIVIATGSEPIELKSIVPFDGDKVVDSTGALEFTTPPKKLAVIGGGIIGLEMGSVWARAGSQVTVIEAQSEILSSMDADVVREMTRIMKKQGLEIRTKTKLKSANITRTKVKLLCETPTGDEEIQADKVLVAVGRRPYTDKLGLENCGVELDERGRVKTDAHFRTNVSGIYAIGDVREGPMLAHKAEDEGVAVGEIIAGQAGHVNYDAIPGVVYTNPEVAVVGKTEQECKAEGLPIKKAKFPFKANGRARCNGDTNGFIKVIAHAETDRILGIHMVGPHVSELVSEAVVAMEFGSSAEDLARSTHAHPTLSESVKEAALAVAGRAIHM